MSEQNKATPAVNDRHKLVSLWAARVFTVFSIIFFIYSFYVVVAQQQGRFDLSDTVMMITTVMMIFISVISYRLIQRDRHALGTGLLFLMVVLIPPTMLTILLKEILPVAIVYIVLMASVMIAQVLPRNSRRLAIAASVTAILLNIGFELWNPNFRINTGISGFTTVIIFLGVLGLLAFSVRQAMSGNLRTKLLAAFIGVAVFSVGVVAFSAQQWLSSSLTLDIGNKLTDQARTRGIEVATTLDREKDILHTLSLSVGLQNAARVADHATPLSQADVDRLDKQWVAADAANNNSDPLVAGVLNNETSAQLKVFQSQFEQHVELFVTGNQGVSIASTNRTSDYNQSDEEWWQIAYRDGKYVGQPEYDPSAKTIATNIAYAIEENGEGDILGVVRTTVNITTLANTLEAGTFGQTGRTIILLPSGQQLRLNKTSGGTYELIEEKALPELLELPQTSSTYQIISLNGISTLASSASVIPVGDTGEDTELIKNLNWRVVTLQDEAEALEPLTTQTRNALIIGFAILIAAIIAAVGLARLISDPIIRLNTVAQKIAGGDITAQAKVETRDEVGTLATTFNSMTSQLREMIGSLEQRVEERTQSLELAAEVSRSVSRVRALDVMLKDAADLIRSRFDLYYVQFYLTDPSQTNLILQSGTGAVGAALVGRNHRLLLNRASINGRAALEKRSVVVDDTTASATFSPNPLLPNTRSEIAVPLIIGETVVGVLDLQSQNVGQLNQGVLPAFEALAGQLAIAIQNSNFLAQVEQARADIEAQARRQTRRNWDDYMDAIHKPEEIGFMFEQNKIALLSQAEKSQTAENSSALVAPIAVTGAALGNLVVEFAGQSPITRTHELVNAVARQVGQQIESLRLLESAERFRFEAEQSARRLTREGWKDFAEANAGKHLSYMYDLNEVRPFQPGADQPMEDSGFSLPLKVRDEAVGKLSVLGLKSDDRESLDLVNAVAERLGAHIESLRQQDQTQLALSQTEKLSGASLRLAQAADMQEVLKVIDETLAISAINRSVLGVFNYNAANELEEMVIGANWWNGSGHEPSEIGRRYTLETLNALPYFTSTTPVFAHDTFNDERITGISLQIVKQQNIRAMAVLPLYIGARQIGVLILESEQVYNFTAANTRLFVAMAPQVATVLENRRQFERAQKQAKRETTLNIISQKIQGATTVEAVLQIAARELGQALGAPRTIAQLSIRDKK